MERPDFIFMIKLKQKGLITNILICGFLFFILATGFLFLAKFSLAQEAVIGLNYAANLDLPSPGDTDLRDLIVRIVRYFLTFIALIAVIVIIYAGFLWMTSGGNPEKIARAKKTLVRGFVGLIIVVVSFAVVTFIINFMNDAITGQLEKNKGKGKIPPGIGAVGNCAIETMYPEDGQTDVPRNLPITVTFVEAVDPGTIIDPANDPYIYDDGRIILIKAGDDILDDSFWIKDVKVTHTPDNKTFVFDPDEYLGSQTSDVKYIFKLTNSITNTDGKGIFRNCTPNYLQSDFTVNTEIDFDPPQVKVNGVFPPPDNEQDGSDSTDPERAEGSITVSDQPDIAKTAEVLNVIKDPPDAEWPNAGVTLIQSSCTEDSLNVFVEVVGNSFAAELRRNITLLGGGSMIAPDTVSFAYCNLVLKMNSGDFKTDCGEGGCKWDITIEPAVTADTLTVGSTVYVFVAAGEASGNQIEVGVDEPATALNIADKLDSRSDLIASAAGNFISLTAEAWGKAGNNIALDTSNPDAFEIEAMDGGIDAVETVIVESRPDQPRNAVIRINFNEPINPITVSGKATDLEDYIRVKCLNMFDAVNNPVDCDTILDPAYYFDCGGDICLAGTFVMSNLYRTVEFVSDNLCGANSCGEPVYCLPENSRLQVEIEAARLLTCPGEVDCSTRAPYVNCNGGVCEDASGINLAESKKPLDTAGQGIADMALNSLDGDRDEEAEGPQAQSGTPPYNENDIIGLCNIVGVNKVCTQANKDQVCGVGVACNGAITVAAAQAGEGDSYLWSFYISDKLELTPPEIDLTNPDNNENNTGLNDPIKISFNKLMMSSSLRPGSVRIFDGQNWTTHRLIRLSNAAKIPVGYWVVSEDIDIPEDGIMDFTQAIIKHSQFPDKITLKVQVGSGVKDIYQNCFNPSIGPACPGQSLPSCCITGEQADPCP